MPVLAIPKLDVDDSAKENARVGHRASILRTVRHPLDGALIKVTRAKEHFAALGVETSTFIEEQLGHIPTNYDPETYSFWVVPTDLAEPPFRLGIIIGDCVHNLRSALDYVVFELAKSGNDGVEVGQTQFPICDSVESWKSAKRRGRLKCVEAKQRAVIDELQPYQALKHGLEPKNHSLSLLRELDDRDKHRLLMTTAGRVRILGGIQMDVPWHSFGRTGSYGYGFPHFVPNDANIPGGIGSGSPSPQMDMNRAVASYITFQDGRPVLDTLATMIQVVDNAVVRFMQAFAGPPLWEPPSQENPPPQEQP